MRRLILNLLAALTRTVRPETITWRVSVGDVALSVRGEDFMLKMLTGQTAPVSVNVTSRRGRPARVQAGSERFESSDPSIVNIQHGGGTSATLQSGDTPGTAVVTFTADADLGDGVREITGVGTVVVSEDEAEVFELSFGEPTNAEEPVTAADEPPPPAASAESESGQ